MVFDKRVLFVYLEGFHFIKPMISIQEQLKKKIHDTINAIGYSNINEGVIDSIIEQVYHARTEEILNMVPEERDMDPHMFDGLWIVPVITMIVGVIIGVVIF